VAAANDGPVSIQADLVEFHRNVAENHATVLNRLDEVIQSRRFVVF